MTAVARLAAVALDTTDPAGLAAFYRELLDLQVMFESDDFVALSGGALYITTQRVADHRPPDWPDGSLPKQMHLELAADDLDGAQAAAVALGAKVAATQPSPDAWRVLLDPAGHPFCLTTLVPDA